MSWAVLAVTVGLLALGGTVFFKVRQRSRRNPKPRPPTADSTTITADRQKVQ